MEAGPHDRAGRTFGQGQAPALEQGFFVSVFARERDRSGRYLGHQFGRPPSRPFLMLSAARGRVYLAENTAPDGGHQLYEDLICATRSIGLTGRGLSCVWP